MSEEKMIDHVVTEEDLKNDPDLVDLGIEVGETIEIPADDPRANPSTKEETPEEETEAEEVEGKKWPVDKDGKPLPSYMVA